MPPTHPTSFSSSDSSLVVRIRAGDISAFEHYFRTNARSAFRFALSLVHDQDLAEDLVQQVFAWIWLHREQWNPNGDLLVYLLGAIRNRALNATRDDKRRSEIARQRTRSDDSPGMASPQPVPDQAVQDSDLRAIVWSLAAELTEQRRTVLALRWYYSLEWDEIAKIMDISVNAAQVHHTRALASLRDRLPEWLRE